MCGSSMECMVYSSEGEWICIFLWTVRCVTGRLSYRYHSRAWPDNNDLLVKHTCRRSCETCRRTLRERERGEIELTLFLLHGTHSELDGKRWSVSPQSASVERFYRKLSGQSVDNMRFLTRRIRRIKLPEPGLIWWPFGESFYFRKVNAQLNPNITKEKNREIVFVNLALVRWNLKPPFCSKKGSRDCLNAHQLEHLL